MGALSCIWYISESAYPWEVLSIAALARKLESDGADITFLCGSGTDLLTGTKALSWKGLTGVERFLWTAVRGRLWHLWGNPPAWWRMIRLRARTIHTALGSPGAWQGHPSVMSSALVVSGESYIPPVFESTTDWGVPDDADDMAVPMLIVAAPPVTRYRTGGLELLGSLDMPVYLLPHMAEEVIPGSRKIAHGGMVLRVLRSSGGILAVPSVNFSMAMLAGYAALSGVPTVARPSALLDEFLGRDGYITVLSPRGREEEPNWMDSVAEARGARGHEVAAIARRRLIERYTSEEASRRIRRLYGRIAGGNV